MMPGSTFAVADGTVPAAGGRSRGAVRGMSGVPGARDIDLVIRGGIGEPELAGGRARRRRPSDRRPCWRGEIARKWEYSPPARIKEVASGGCIHESGGVPRGGMAGKSGAADGAGARRRADPWNFPGFLIPHAWPGLVSNALFPQAFKQELLRDTVGIVEKAVSSFD